MPKSIYSKLQLTRPLSSLKNLNNSLQNWANKPLSSHQMQMLQVKMLLT